MEWCVSAFSRVGGREQNEDSCGYVEKDGMVCCVLADGAGGHRGGEVASRICVQSVLDQFLAKPDVAVSSLNQMLHDANQAVLRQQEADRSLADMRSTLVVLLFDPYRHSAVWGHVGDSRLYLFRNGCLQLRTRDHSLAQSMMDSGMVPPSAAQHLPDANILFASAGLQDAFLPAVLDSPFSLRKGDAFLLCSDGVWGAVDDASLEQCLGLSPSSDAWLQCIERKVTAAAASGSDNYSAIGIWCGDADDFMHTVPIQSRHN